MGVKVDVVVSYYQKAIYFDNFLAFAGTEMDISISEVLESLQDEVIEFSRTIVAHPDVCYAKIGFPDDLEDVRTKDENDD